MFVYEEVYVFLAIAADIFAFLTCEIQFFLLVKKCFKGQADPVDRILSSLCVANLLAVTSVLAVDSFRVMDLCDGWMYMAFDYLFTFFTLVATFHIVYMAIARLLMGISAKKHHHNKDGSSTSNKHKFVVIVSYMAAIMLTLTALLLTLKDVCNLQRIILGSVFEFAAIVTMVVYFVLFICLVRQQQHNDVEQTISQQKSIKSELLSCIYLPTLFSICMVPYGLGLIQSSFYHPFSNVLITLYHGINPIHFIMKYCRDIKRERGLKELEVNASMVQETGETSKQWFWDL